MTESGSAELASALDRAFRDGTLPAYRKAKAQQWVLACDELLRDGRFDCFTYSVRHLHEAFPEAQRVEDVTVCDRQCADRSIAAVQGRPVGRRSNCGSSGV